METLISLRRVDDPKKAVAYLRDLAVQQSGIGWTLVEELAGIHCSDALPTLRRHFAHRNDTGLASCLEDEAAQLESAIVEDMTRPDHPLSSGEAEMRAYRITLLRLLAHILRALHNREEAVVEIGSPAALQKAA